MAQWDLTNQIAQYLDRHLVFPLFEFVERDGLYVERDLQEAKFALLSKTSMVDSAIDMYKGIHGLGEEEEDEKTKELSTKREEVLATYGKLEEDVKPVLEMLSKPDVQQQISGGMGDGSTLRDYLEQNHGLQSDQLKTLYDYAQLLYDIGQYDDAGGLLYQYNILSADPEHTFSALWGRVASSILSNDPGHWQNAMEDLNRLKETIDTNNPAPALRQLQQRTWLLHWSLFVFFNHDEGLDHIIDLFLYQQSYANTIQTVCPHLLRYLTAAVIAQSQTQKRRDVLKMLVKVIQQESYAYSDPITEFVECLYVKFDFDGAQQKLRECEVVIMNDFFLGSIRTTFIENARRFIFETYCRMHNTISIGMLAEKLNMDLDQAEQWIVNLIRNARLDAKIDSKKGNVLMTPKVPDIYHTIIESTKGLSLRSQELAGQIERKRGGPGQGGRGGNGY